MVLPHDSDPRLAAPRSRSEPTVAAGAAAGAATTAAAAGQAAGQQTAGTEAPQAGAGVEPYTPAGFGSGLDVPAAPCTAAAPAPEGAIGGLTDVTAGASGFADAALQLAKRESVPALVEGMLPQVGWLWGLMLGCWQQGIATAGGPVILLPAANPPCPF